MTTTEWLAPGALCVPCIVALPELRALVADLPADRFALLAVSVDEELATVTEGTWAGAATSSGASPSAASRPTCSSTRRAS